MPLPRSAVAAALVVMAFVVQVVILSRLRLPGATPDLVLLVLVGLALAHGPMTGIVTGFGAGLVLDLAPPADHAAGRWALVFCLVGYFCGLAHRETREMQRPSLASPFEPVAVARIVAVASVCSTVLYAGLGALLGDPRVVWSALYVSIPAALLYDVILSLVVVPAVIVLARRAEPL